MAQQTTVILTDDIDGSKAVETVTFGLDDKYYEIDLGSKNAKNLVRSWPPTSRPAERSGPAVERAVSSRRQPSLQTRT